VRHQLSKIGRKGAVPTLAQHIREERGFLMSADADRPRTEKKAYNPDKKTENGVNPGNKVKESGRCTWGGRKPNSPAGERIGPGVVLLTDHKAVNFRTNSLPSPDGKRRTSSFNCKQVFSERGQEGGGAQTLSETAPSYQGLRPPEQRNGRRGPSLKGWDGDIA